MKTAYKVLGILVILIALSASVVAIKAFEKEVGFFSFEWEYWLLQFLELILIVITLSFAVLLFRPNVKLTSHLLWATVLVLIVISCISSGINRNFGGLESYSLSIVTGIPVILSGVCSLLVMKNDQSLFYDEFKSKLNV
ncbi:hypothetical protein [Flavobacterium sp. N1994]|uniref:hypothetical protein n=1 Tax=Flavobacterium sp. N1994 TaxID=2986827 RepID=UPI0022224A38|nr:hypothetical protein [Flavobacterium sp. N1994]